MDLLRKDMQVMTDADGHLFLSVTDLEDALREWAARSAADPSGAHYLRLVASELRPAACAALAA